MNDYDYSQPGAYFVTVVTQDRAPMFGDVVNGNMRLNAAGEMVQRKWEELPVRFPNIGLDEVIVMPNHIHGIILVEGPVGAPLVGARGGDGATADVATTKLAREDDGAATGVDQENYEVPADGATTRVAPTLGNIVGAYKSIVTVEYARGVRANGWAPFRGRLWQRNYYERVKRDDVELGRAREYIVNNPAQWELDRENPKSPTNRNRRGRG